MWVRFTALDVREWYRRAPQRREWIVVRTMRDDREYQLSLTKRFFLDEVWNALVAAGAIPRSDGLIRRDRL